eukprot:1233380-Prymnesium_polylepis.2
MKVKKSTARKSANSFQSLHLQAATPTRVERERWSQIIPRSRKTSLNGCGPKLNTIQPEYTRRRTKETMSGRAVLIASLRSMKSSVARTTLSKIKKKHSAAARLVSMKLHHEGARMAKV